jgi:hypothetical protein
VQPSFFVFEMKNKKILPINNWYYPVKNQDCF